MISIVEDVLREVRYCAAAPGSRLGGQVGRAQEEALRRGWLADAVRPGFLQATAAGRAAIAALAAP